MKKEFIAPEVTISKIEFGKVSCSCGTPTCTGEIALI
jgi:hypothetical protein